MELQTDVAAPTDQHPEPVPRPRVVVGSDDSPAARAALAYAFAAAASRHAALDVVLAYPVTLPWAWEPELDVHDVEPVRAAMSRTVEEHRSLLGSAVPDVADVPVRVLVGRGSAADVLVEESGRADLLVVGSRGRGAVRSALLGSVALHCVTAAHCPVVVVHEPAAGDAAQQPPGSAQQAPRVVVGVDGSPESKAALAVALEEAAAMEAVVDVVAAYSLADAWIGADGDTPPTPEEIRTQVGDRLEAAVEGVRDGLPADLRSGLPGVRTVVIEGNPADALLDRAEGARLLVVGGHGHSVLRGLMLGSVALGCVLHAPCPVMVVHAPPSPSDAVPVAAAGAAQA